MSRAELEDLLTRWFDAREQGLAPDIDDICRDAPEHAAELRRLLQRLGEHEVTAQLRPDPDAPGSAAPAPPPDRPPDLPGFRVIEKIGEGGAGTVWKVLDLKLGRQVAAKVLKTDNKLGSGARDVVREAVALALFDDPRIVRVHELRDDVDPPVLLMELVEGFALDDFAPSLELRQRVAIVVELCEAIDRAHRLGLTHRDLKPANIMLDRRLQPRILDFGLSDSDPTRGHLLGSPHYLAPEQLDPSAAIDARTDIHALGLILYELLCGARAYGGATVDDVLAAVRRGRPRLPVEVEPTVPEPLQAVALKAMDPAPSERYASAREMARDLRRWLGGRAVLARPGLYASVLERRIRPHLQQIDEWLQQRLIHAHEARTLQAGYRRLEAREDDWIIASRTLSMSQVTLYLGAFLVAFGSVLLWIAHQAEHAVSAGATLVGLGLPAALLAAGGLVLYRARHEAVAVAFFLAGALSVPFLLLVAARQLGLGPPGDADLVLLDADLATNRELQLALFGATAWTLPFALRTRTTALASAVIAGLALLHGALLGDLGLRRWIEDDRWDVLAVHLLPLLLVFALIGLAADRRGRSWLAGPAHVAAMVLFVAVLELVCLEGRALSWIGLSVERFSPDDDESRTLLATLLAMSAVGLVVHAAGAFLERRGPETLRRLSWLFLAVCPFATLEPLLRISVEQEFAEGLDWLYLLASLAFVAFSHLRERKSFYYAGLLNSGLALAVISDRREWLDAPGWAVAILTVGLTALGAGLGLEVWERLHRPSTAGQ